MHMSKYKVYTWIKNWTRGSYEHLAVGKISDSTKIGKILKVNVKILWIQGINKAIMWSLE